MRINFDGRVFLRGLLFVFMSIKCTIQYSYNKIRKKDLSQYLCQKIIEERDDYINYFSGIFVFIIVLFLIANFFTGFCSFWNYILAFFIFWIPLFYLITPFFRFGDIKVTTTNKRIIFGCPSLDLFQEYINRSVNDRDKKRHFIIHEIFIFFIFIIICFSFVYYLIYKSNPRFSFFDAFHSKRTFLSYWDFLHFSFITASTVGFGDIVARNHVIQLIVVIEIVISWITILVFIASTISTLKEPKKDNQQTRV